MQLAKARMLLPKQGTYNKPRAGLHQFNQLELIWRPLPVARPCLPYKRFKI